MPSKRFRKSRGKKGKRRKPRRKQRPLPPLGFPLQSFARLRVAGSITLDGTQSTLATYFLSANAVHLPDPTQASKQPRHFDVYASIYNRYKVVGSKLTLTPVGPNSTEAKDQIFGIMVNNTGSLQSPNNTLTALMEDPKAFGNMRRVSGAAVSLTKPLTSKFSIYRAGGTLRDSDDVLDGITGNSYVSASAPSRQLYYCIYTGRAGLDVADPSPINFTYVIDYLVNFWEFNLKMPLA